MDALVDNHGDAVALLVVQQVVEQRRYAPRRVEGGASVRGGVVVLVRGGGVVVAMRSALGTLILLPAPRKPESTVTGRGPASPAPFLASRLLRRLPGAG